MILHVQLRTAHAQPFTAAVDHESKPNRKLQLPHPIMHSLEISFLIFTFLTSSLQLTTCFLYSYIPTIRVDVRSKKTHPFFSILQPSGWKPGSQLQSSRSSQNTYASPSNYTSNGRESPLKSKIVSIRSRNLCGAINPDGQDIHVTLEDGNLIAVTGETGSGKSLLVSKVADLVTGGKATSSLLQNTNGADATATVEMGKEQQYAAIF
jgi:ABC-type multidrug transport system fused ATPase/permease subunit